MRRAFVPVCLYSNGFFLIKENIKFFLHVFSDYDEILFVVVDKLYGHNLLIKEKVACIEDATQAYQKRGKDIYSLLSNTIKEYNATNLTNSKIIIKLWKDFDEVDDYKLLKQKIIHVFDSNPNLHKYCEAFILHSLELMTNHITSYKKHLEHDYLFSEIAMSIYLTEFCGFSDEVWERPQSPTIPDPLDLLYRSEKNSLHLILSRVDSSRRQLYLKDVIDTYLNRLIH